MAEFCLICCVVNMGAASKTLKIAKKLGVKGGTISIGRGTVQSRLPDILGINEVRKEIVSMIVEDGLAADIIRGIGEEMRFQKPNHGIAFSYAVSEFIGSKSTDGMNLTSSEVKNGVYKVIFVIVDKGKGGEVIEAAGKAGAKGGTIVHARGSGIHEVQKLFSVEIEPEKEEIFIIVKAELKDAIVESIRRDLKIDEPGTGVIFIVDVNEVYGLHDE